MSVLVAPRVVLALNVSTTHTAGVTHEGEFDSVSVDICRVRYDIRMDTSKHRAHKGLQVRRRINSIAQGSNGINSIVNSIAPKITLGENERTNLEQWRHLLALQDGIEVLVQHAADILQSWPRNLSAALESSKHL